MGVTKRTCLCEWRFPPAEPELFGLALNSLRRPKLVLMDISTPGRYAAACVRNADQAWQS